MTTSVEDLPAVRALLRFGYVLEWKDDPAKGWRCTIASDDERWEGEGPDQQAALEDALHRLAPSKIARKLLERAGADVVELGSKSGVRIAAGVDVGAGLQPGSRDLPAMLADLQTIAARVEAGIPEVALMAPPLQKLHVLAWISHARAIEQEAGKHRAVIEATGAIARRLTALSKTWWPGSVRALQVDATPEGAAREQGLPPASRWIEVAEAAEERLETAIAEPPGDDGWKDTAALLPPPEDPEREIDIAVDAIERVLGPIDVLPRGEPQPVSPADELHLEDAAVRLRWSRPFAPDPERWGAAIGRLRWLAAHRRGGPRLPRLLDPGYVPRPSWAAEAHTTRSRLLANRPPPDGPQDFLKWLLAAFDAVDTPTLANRLRDGRTVSGAPALSLALAVRESDLPSNDRRLRRRLRQLQALLRGTPDEAETTTEAASPLTPADSPGAVASRSSYEERIFARVRALIPEAFALFVSNREDPELRERLEKALGWQIEWSTTEPRRIAAVAKAVAHGTYRVVLSATGFQDHATDITLARAANASQTLYVRVHRGRVAACARALARELGIRADELEREEPERDESATSRAVG